MTSNDEQLQYYLSGIGTEKSCSFAVEDTLEISKEELRPKGGAILKQSSSSSKKSLSSNIRAIDDPKLYTTYASCNCDFSTGERKVVDFLNKSETDYLKLNTTSFNGYTIHESKQACFKLEFVNIASDLSLLCQRMQGSANALTEFFNNLKLSCNFSVPQTEKIEAFEQDQELEMDDDDDSWFSDTDKEDGDFGDLEMDSLKYLDLSYDDTVMQNWLEDLQDSSPDEIENTLLLMCFNINKNLKQFQEVSKQLVKVLLDIIQQNNVSLPIAQSATQILSVLKTNGYVFNNEEWAILCKCLLTWSPAGQRKPSFDVPVPVSNNIQNIVSTLIASVLVTLPQNLLNMVEQVKASTQNDNVKANLTLQK